MRPRLRGYDVILRVKRAANRAEQDAAVAEAARLLAALAGRAHMKAVLLALHPRLSVPAAADARQPTAASTPSCSDYAREAIERHGAVARHLARRPARRPLSPVSSRGLRPRSLTAIRGRTRCPRAAFTKVAMDTQRIILFVVFSFSALLPVAGVAGGARAAAAAADGSKPRPRRPARGPREGPARAPPATPPAPCAAAGAVPAAADGRAPAARSHDQDRSLHGGSRHRRRRHLAGVAHQAPRRDRPRPSPTTRCSARPSACSSRRRA